MSRKWKRRETHRKKSKARSACSLCMLSPEAAAKQLLSRGITAVRESPLLSVLRCIQAYFLCVVVCIYVFVCLCGATIQLETE